MTTNPTWIQQAREKIAGTQTKDDQAIAEAFAQQAYTAVGNRDRAIMKDPYLLGFEIVDKNEDNNRLVGVFAFRVSGEILMVPVFYLNGQIKGQDLIYRKPVNRFYPNTEKWVNYFVGRGQDETGRPIARRSNADARIHLGINRMSRMPGGYKQGSAGDEGPIDIQAEWKEACDNSGFQPEHLDQFMFADFLVDHGLQKAAATLANRVPWFADTIVLAKLLDKPLTKKASAPRQSLEYHVDPPAGATEAEVAAHYTRGFSFVDKRAKESLAAAIESSPISRTWSSLRKPGINRVAGRDGSFQKVLWAPTTSDCSDRPYSPGERRHSSNPEHRLVFLEGPDKGCVITYRQGCAETELPLFTDDAAVEKEAGFGDTLGKGVRTALNPVGAAASAMPQGVKDFGSGIAEGAKELARPITDPVVNAGKAVTGWFGDVADAGRTLTGKNPPPAQAHTAPRPEIPMPASPSQQGPLINEKSMQQQIEEQLTDLLRKQSSVEEVPGDSTPKKGKTYVVWLPELGKLFGEPFHVKSVESTGDVTKINFEGGSSYGETQCRVILRKDLEATCAADFRGNSSTGMPRVIGGDAVWIPIEAQLHYEHGMPETAANVSYATFQPPASFQPVTLSTIDEALSNSKQASITIERDTRSGLFSLRGPDGKLRLEDLPARHLAIKLARDMRLPAEEALELLDLAKVQEKVAFTWLAPGYADAISETFTGMTTKEAAWLQEAEEFDGLMKEAGPSELIQKWILSSLKGRNAVRAVDRFGKSMIDASHLHPEGTNNIWMTAGLGGFGTGLALPHMWEAGKETAGLLGDSFQKVVSPDATTPQAMPGSPSKEELITKATTPGETPGNPTTTLPTKDVAPDLMAKLTAALKNPYVLGGLAAGTGAAAYGISKLKGKKEKKPVDSVDTADSKESEKEASAYYDRDIDPRVQFQNYDWDEDMDIPIENSGQFQDYADARRERYTRPAQNYLDAHDPGQGRNQRSQDIDHIPDDVILRMVNPMQEMAQLGQQMGLETLMDHGAVGSLVKVFDVKPYMQEYVSKLENSLDHLGRLLFMLYWKPKDFSELFGQDDIPQIENKLTGVFSSYGDLVLELLQSSGDK